VGKVAPCFGLWGSFLAAAVELPNAGLVVLPGAPAVVAAGDSSVNHDWLQFPDASAIPLAYPINLSKILLGNCCDDVGKGIRF